ncbi:hypothetical protein ES319_A07G136700v1 [Gossypium barbadense]|uniref:Uncharacterized protein n=2 Tax=Gossypium TaxID=3633 RepID=A0A5J5V3J3_GOSBA|nr:hypothetical protein ES319_A07G136700v1 [Gossypium barbadense]TYI19171.1 hypothetical protein ES332_A07G146000v1 [Gossypium tomentosum]
MGFQHRSIPRTNLPVFEVFEFSSATTQIVALSVRRLCWRTEVRWRPYVGERHEADGG